jgi:DNA topoisomerase VI subunit B
MTKLPVQRTVFSTPRAAEFLETRALQAQTGQPAEAFGDVVIKELIDNALDAAESAGVAPVIDISTRTEGDITCVTVTDNGAGITDATITDICDFGVLASDKARYRGPARGAQGNALKTLLGIPFALEIAEPVIIESRRRTRRLQVSVDPAGQVTVDRKVGTSPRRMGTSVTVPLPADLDIDPARWAYGAALVNPHATISVDNQAYNGEDADSILYKTVDQGWSKWTPSSPSSPHWYDQAAFLALVYAHIHDTRGGSADKPLGQFIAEFDGLSGSAKQKAIRTLAPGVTHLSQLAGRDDVIAALHTAMCTHAKPTPASRLGPVGADHYRAMLDDEYGVRRFWYSTKTVTVGGVPWVAEVAVADTVKPGRTHFACNHSPAFGDPLARADLRAGEIATTGAASFLTAADADGDGPSEDDDSDALMDGNRAAVVHIVCAAAQFVDKGKVALVAPAEVAAAASAALDGATKVLRREVEQRRKDARKANRAAQRARDDGNRAEKQMSVKDAVFQVLPKAKAAAGKVVDVRTLYYKVRPLIQSLTDAELGYSYFTQTLVPEYQRTVAKLDGLYYEGRGELHHPHDGVVIKLGTREVEAYIPPSWQFNKILYIEKTGLAEQLESYQLAQRLDMAIIYGKGYAVTACRDLLALFSEITDMKIFVLHDADIDGYIIARTLGEATRRMPDHNIDVIDLGLTVPQAIEHQLETENFTRKKALPADLVLDDDAEDWFTGEPFTAARGKTHYTCTRCELNAFSADELAEFIESGLRAHGATGKLLPPADVLTEHVQTSRDEALTARVMDRLMELVDIDAVVRRLRDEHPGLADVTEADVRDRFGEHPTESWRAAADQLVEDAADGPGLGDRVAELITEQLDDELEDGDGQ